MKPYWQASAFDIAMVNQQNREYFRQRPVAHDAKTTDEVLMLKKQKDGTWILKDRTGRVLGRGPDHEELEVWARGQGYNLRIEEF